MPYRLRYQLAWDHGLCRAVLRVYTRALREAYRRGARARGIDDGQTGTVTVIQRAGGALNVNVHFHTLVLDGVFSEDVEGALVFHPAPGPSDAEVAAALATIRRRVQRLLVRRGREPADDATGPADRLADESPVLAGLVGASVQGRVALGHARGRARAPPRRRARPRSPSPPAARVRPSSTASTSTPTSGSRQTIGPASSNSAAISSVPRSRRSGSGYAPTDASLSSSRRRGSQ